MPPHCPPEVRAQAVARVLAGESTNKIARDLGVASRTVRNWALAVGAVHPVSVEKINEWKEIVADLLREQLKTLKIQNGFYRDGEWIKKYSPADAAILYGVLADKAYRILEAGGADEDLDSAAGAADTGSREPG